MRSRRRRPLASDTLRFRLKAEGGVRPRGELDVAHETFRGAAQISNRSCRLSAGPCRHHLTPHCSVRGRQGFTLLEILVVVSVLVVIATVVMPSMSSMGGRGAMMTASGDVARFLTDVRRSSIDNGVRRWVRFEVDGRSLLAGNPDTAADATFELPEDYAFGDHENAERLPDVIAETATVEQKQAVWSPEISFYPDGTASTVSWTVSDDGGRTRTMSVRGETGRIRVTLGGG